MKVKVRRRAGDGGGTTGDVSGDASSNTIEEMALPACLSSFQFQLGANMVLPSIDHACRKCGVGDSFVLTERASSLLGCELCGQ